MKGYQKGQNPNKLAINKNRPEKNSKKFKINAVKTLQRNAVQRNGYSKWNTASEASPPSLVMPLNVLGTTTHHPLHIYIIIPSATITTNEQAYRCCTTVSEMKLKKKKKTTHFLTPALLTC